MSDDFVFKSPIPSVVDNGSDMFPPPMPPFEDPVLDQGIAD